MHKPTILVLLDLKENPEELLEASAGLAKQVEGRLQALHVRMPIEAIEQENQLSAKKEFYDHYQDTKEQLEPIINTVSEKVGLSIDYSLVYGNVGSEINEIIKQRQPDFTVLGKRRSKLGGLIGDRVTNTVLSIAKNAIFIVDTSNVLKTFEGITVGSLRDMGLLENGICKSVIEDQRNKVNYFGIGDKNEEAQLENGKGSQFVFPKNSGAISNMASYVSKTKTHLFCIPKVALSEREAFTKKLIAKLTTNVLLA